jgi:hypothetical protein
MMVLCNAGATYYYSYRNQIYRYPNELVSKPIEMIDNFKGSAYFDNWYVYLVSDTSTNPETGVVYVYDEIVGSWYVFSMQFLKLLDIAKINEYLMFSTGGDATNSFVLKYTSIANDFSESTEFNDTKIVPKITFPKLVVNGMKDKFRMLKLFAKYDKLASESVSHTINGASITDSTSSGEKNEELTIGTFTSPFTHARTLQYDIQGVGLSEFEMAELEFNETRRR